MRRPLSVDAFQETVMRYCRRFQADERDFCLAAITVLEYRLATEKEKESLDKAVVSVLFKFLRAEDRICFIEPAHYLILTPSTSLEDAHTAMRRVAERISHAKIRTKSSFMHPSADARVVSARQKANESEGLVDPEMLFNTVGYTLDSKGRLLCVEDVDDGDAEPLFRGNLDGWMERYSSGKNKSRKKQEKTSPAKSKVQLEVNEALQPVKHLRDRWNHDAVVELREITLPCHQKNGKDDDTMRSALATNLLRRLRILQNLEHPGINQLLDFYASREGHLLLVNKPPEGLELTDEVLKDKHSFTLNMTMDILIAWLQQILNAVIAMQTVVPPVVPSAFDAIRIFYCENGGKDGGQLVLCNYDIDYVLAACLTGSDSTQVTAAPSGQQRLMQGMVQFILEVSKRCKKSKEHPFTSFLQNLDSSSLNTPYKLRAQLKKFVEEQHA